jgi:hypothetical protein
LVELRGADFAQRALSGKTEVCPHGVDVSEDDEQVGGEIDAEQRRGRVLVHHRLDAGRASE